MAGIGDGSIQVYNFSVESVFSLVTLSVKLFVEMLSDLHTLSSSSGL